MSTERSTLKVNPDVELALRQFTAAVQEIFASDPTEPFQKRQQYIEAITEVAELLYRLGRAKEGSRVNLLAEMLDDLRRGTMHEVLKPPVKGSLSPTATFRGRSYVAQAVEVLVTGGRTSSNKLSSVKRREAAEYLAKKHPELSRFMDNESQNLATTIFNWDRQYRRGQMNHEEVYKSYQIYLPKLVSAVEAFPEEVRKERSRIIASALVEEALKRCN